MIPIGGGSILKATWSRTYNLVACKKLRNNQPINMEVVHRGLNMYKRLDFCSRFIRILGISLDENTNGYLLIMQYADSGNLREYLKQHFSKLTWNDKFILAYQIAEGIKYLHEEDILHRNLHSKNIVIHKGEAKIMLDIVKNTEADHDGFQMISYFDPKLLENHSYEFDKKSDIYSLGVLMWELSSGNPPFIDNESKLINGFREEPIPNTPNEYKKLYELCWHSEPELRPSIIKVFNKLGKMLYAQNNKILKPSEFIKAIQYYNLVNVIKIDELSEKSKISKNLLKATWKKTVVCKRFKDIQLNGAFLHELKMHKKLNFWSRITCILGISIDEINKEYLLVMQYADSGNLREYLKHNFSTLTWDDKIKLAYQITEGIQYFHDKDIFHRYLNSKNIVIHQGEAKIMLDIVKNTETEYFNDSEMISYIDPKLLENPSYEYDDKSDIYSLGVIMWELTSGHPPNNGNILKSHLIDGYREKSILGISKEYLNLYKSCWNSEPNARPSINQVFSKLEDMKKTLGSELINQIKKSGLVKIIDKNELLNMTEFDGGHFGVISKATWKKTNNTVICKRLKNNASISNKPIDALLHELKMHRRLDFCQRIIRILGISLDEKSKEYLLIMQYADNGDLRKYLKQNFSNLIWDDKIKFAYQITEGIKYLHGEKILHRDLHSGNIVIHQGEAKIIDLGIAKSTETETQFHSGVFGMIAYIDPKLFEDHSYKYDNKSDIYSLGVLMWELSSGKPPFADEKNENILKYQLIDGRREEKIPETPSDYLKLYKLCWDPDPNLRPTIDKVFIDLGRMLGIQDDNINDNDIQVLENNENEQIKNFGNDNNDLSVPDEMM
ncbi:kinase-like domain-containing protein [Glomus cerebriforme]|uniref:Kinase-like domain-containing protein n=1 Tax=Glomus cerebriforme TaxID=658196 RepID=A0A397SR65_9GLOM|nr:kinase-like domain-containing protein [Glomus cerebriforme]